jgi:hypothetical protein
MLHNKCGRASRPTSSSPWRHRRVLPNRDPYPLAPPTEQGVELGPAYRDGPAVGQRHGATRRIHGRDQVAFRDQVRLDEQFDVAHARTSAPIAPGVEEIGRSQSEKSLPNRINSTEEAATRVPSCIGGLGRAHVLPCPRSNNGARHVRGRWDAAGLDLPGWRDDLS